MRRMLFSAALLVVVAFPGEGLAQSSVLRAAVLSGGGAVSAGTVSIKAGLGESFASNTGPGGATAVRTGVWLPQAPTPTAVGDTPPIVGVRTSLGQNSPNPFNPRTVIPFAISNAGAHVRLAIYSVAGRHVRTLVNGPLPAGPHAIVWNGTDANERTVASGVYLYLLETSDFRAHRKLVLVR